MFSFFSPYKLLIEVVLIGAMFAGIAFGVHRFLEHEQKIGYDKAVAEYNVKLIAAEQAATAKEKLYADQLQAAQNAAAAREQTLKTVVAASANSSNSLRDTLGAISRGVPTATINALRVSTAALGAVFADCTRRYQGLAEIADRHVIDIKTLQDAWPK